MWTLLKSNEYPVCLCYFHTAGTRHTLDEIYLQNFEHVLYGPD